MGKEIIVVQAGWVFIGDVVEVPLITIRVFKWVFTYGVKELQVNNASSIRAWGTTAGLGEIAIKGPTPKTLLDFTGFMIIPNHAVIARIICKE